MSQTLSFVKMAAAGNDFVVVDNRRSVLRGDLSKWAQRLCDRKFSIGADGLLLVERSKKADIQMRIFNPDGSQADMCGNGVRCVAQFAVMRKIVKPRHSIETGAGIIQAQVKGKTVRARLTDPGRLRTGVLLNVDGRMEHVNLINTGVPHAVLFEKSLKEVDVQGRGRGLRSHDYFAPKGTNVNFVKICSGNSIEVRTYERGVEAETLACGTGSTASALVAAALKRFHSPVLVTTSGGEKLKVYFKKENGRWTDVYLEGPVQTSFEGSVRL